MPDPFAAFFLFLRYMLDLFRLFFLNEYDPYWAIRHLNQPAAVEYRPNRNSPRNNHNNTQSADQHRSDEKDEDGEEFCLAEAAQAELCSSSRDYDIVDNAYHGNNGELEMTSRSGSLRSSQMAIVPEDFTYSRHNSRDDQLRDSNSLVAEEDDTESVMSEQQQQQQANDGEWKNHAFDIMVTLFGRREVDIRHRRQQDTFKKGCEKASLVDGLAVVARTGKLRSAFEAVAKLHAATYRRSRDPCGVGGYGYVTFEPDRRIPANKFFHPGDMHEIRMKHFNFPDASDDRRMGWRCMSLKLGDAEIGGDLDLVLETGEISPVFNADTFEQLYTAFRQGTESMRDFLTSLPVCLESTVNGMRCQPASYSDQYYYSSVTYDFQADDDVRRCCRLRVIPAAANQIAESGRLTQREQNTIWYSIMLDFIDNTRLNSKALSAKYLREEFARRLSHNSKIEYLLQIQLHQFQQLESNSSSSSSNMMYNASLAWDEASHPWMTVGKIAVTSVLPDDVSNATCYSYANVPNTTLSLPQPIGLHDFRVAAFLKDEVQHFAYRILQHSTAEATAPRHLTEYIVCWSATPLQESHVEISLIGQSSRTKFVKLHAQVNGKSTSKSRRGDGGLVDGVMTFRLKHVGQLMCVKVRWRSAESGSVTSSWYLHTLNVIVPCRSHSYRLPCHRWFNRDVTSHCLRPTACLAQEDNDVTLKVLRQIEIRHMQRLHQKTQVKDLYKCSIVLSSQHHNHSLPGRVKTSTITQQQRHVLHGLQSSYADITRDATRNNVTSQEAAMLTRIFDTWHSDDELLKMIFPCARSPGVRQIYSLANFLNPEDQNTLETVLADNGVNLSEQLQAGNIYRCYINTQEFVRKQLTADQTSMDDLDGGKSDTINDILRNYGNRLQQLFSTDNGHASSNGSVSRPNSQSNTAAATLEAKSKGRSDHNTVTCCEVIFRRTDLDLLPLVITVHTRHLSQPMTIIKTTTNTSSVSTAGDLLWAFAQMCAKNARLISDFSDIARSETVIHFVTTSLLSHVSSVHPIHRLLIVPLSHAVDEPFAQNLLSTVLERDCSDPKMFLKSFHYKEWNFLSGIENNPQRSPCSCRNVLKSLWLDVEQLVGELIDIFYTTEDAFEGDDELAEWLSHLSNSLHEYAAEFPAFLENKRSLVELLTALLFQCLITLPVRKESIFLYSAFLPNAPPFFRISLLSALTSASENQHKRFQHSLLPDETTTKNYVENLRKWSKRHAEKENIIFAWLTLFDDFAICGAVSKFQSSVSDTVDHWQKSKSNDFSCSYEMSLEVVVDSLVG